MSGCRWSSSAGAGLVCRLSVSVWMFELQKVCGVCSSSKTVDFKHLIVNEKLL